jgi:hypothetical protein
MVAIAEFDFLLHHSLHQSIIPQYQFSRLRGARLLSPAPADASRTGCQL